MVVRVVAVVLIIGAVIQYARSNKNKNDTTCNNIHNVNKNHNFVVPLTQGCCALFGCQH